MILLSTLVHGPLAHLVERYYGIVEVVGSSPTRSTHKNGKYKVGVKSSSGKIRELFLKIFQTIDTVEV